MIAEGETAYWDEANLLLHRMLTKRIHPSKRCIDKILDGALKDGNNNTNHPDLSNIVLTLLEIPDLNLT